MPIIVSWSVSLDQFGSSLEMRGDTNQTEHQWVPVPAAIATMNQYSEPNRSISSSSSNNRSATVEEWLSSPKPSPTPNRMEQTCSSVEFDCTTMNNPWSFFVPTDAISCDREDPLYNKCMPKLERVSSSFMEDAVTKFDMEDDGIPGIDKCWSADATDDTCMTYDDGYDDDDDDCNNSYHALNDFMDAAGFDRVDLLEDDIYIMEHETTLSSDTTTLSSDSSVPWCLEIEASTNINRALIGIVGSDTTATIASPPLPAIMRITAQDFQKRRANLSASMKASHDSRRKCWDKTVLSSLLGESPMTTKLCEAESCRENEQEENGFAAAQKQPTHVVNLHRVLADSAHSSAKIQKLCQ